MMTDDELLYAVLDDKIRECESNNYISNTNFLDIYQQSKAIQYFSPTMRTKIFSSNVTICRSFLCGSTRTIFHRFRTVIISAR